MRGLIPCVLRDLGLVGVLVALVVPAASWLGPFDDDVIHQVLTIAAAAVAAVAAILADLSARVGDLPRVAWSGAAFAVYSVVLIPSTTMTVPDDPVQAAGLDAARLVGYVTVMVLLLLAVRPSRRGGAWGGWAIAAAGSLLALGVAELMALSPTELLSPLSEPGVAVIALCGWGWVAAAYVQQGVIRDRSPLWRIGIGIGVLAGAQIYRIVYTTSADDLRAEYAALRLLGLVVIAVAVGGLWLRVMRQVRAREERQADALRLAVVQLQRTADAGARRDHELSNGIRGLTGVATLLSGPQDGRHARLRSAVLAELTRLRHLVDRARPQEPIADVTGVLHETAALYQARGMAVVTATEPDLHAEIPDEVLRQVLANLLANVERHAPGAGVELAGRAEGGIVVVSVHDDGPGVPAGSEELVFEPGVGCAEDGGAGLGLHISRELIAEHGATLTIAPHDPSEPGCAAVLTLTASEPVRTAVGLRTDDHRDDAADG